MHGIDAEGGIRPHESGQFCEATSEVGVSLSQRNEPPAPAKHGPPRPRCNAGQDQAERGPSQIAHTLFLACGMWRDGMWHVAGRHVACGAGFWTSEDFRRVQACGVWSWGGGSGGVL